LFGRKKHRENGRKAKAEQKSTGGFLRMKKAQKSLSGHTPSTAGQQFSLTALPLCARRF
jgi:hypothetical protein